MKDRFDETSAIWTEEYSSRCAAPAKHKQTFTPYHDRICSICELHLQTEASLRISNWQNVISCTNVRAPVHSVRGSTTSQSRDDAGCSICGPNFDLRLPFLTLILHVRRGALDVCLFHSVTSQRSA